EKPGRVYALGEAAAHLVGYETRVTADDLQRLASQGYEESDWVGRTGLEAWGERILAGQKGGRITIQDTASGRVLRTIADKPMVQGADLQLTIDADVQSKAYDTLGEKTGSVVALDPRDDSLLAVVSRPSFDPNHFVAGLSDAEWQSLNGEAHPLVF